MWCVMLIIIMNKWICRLVCGIIWWLHVAFWSMKRFISAGVDVVFLAALSDQRCVKVLRSVHSQEDHQTCRFKKAIHWWKLPETSDHFRPHDDWSAFEFITGYELISQLLLLQLKRWRCESWQGFLLGFLRPYYHSVVLSGFHGFYLPCMNCRNLQNVSRTIFSTRQCSAEEWDKLFMAHTETNDSLLKQDFALTFFFFLTWSAPGCNSPGTEASCQSTPCTLPIQVVL